jgi:hypothetical protein
MTLDQISKLASAHNAAQCKVSHIVIPLVRYLFKKAGWIYRAAAVLIHFPQFPSPHFHHHHRHYEGLDVFPVPWSSRRSWSLHLFLGRRMFLRPFGLYCSACFGILFVSILCTCCSHLTPPPLKPGPIQLREHTPTEKHAGLEASSWQPHH